MTDTEVNIGGETEHHYPVSGILPGTGVGFGQSLAKTETPGGGIVGAIPFGDPAVQDATGGAFGGDSWLNPTGDGFSLPDPGSSFSIDDLPPAAIIESTTPGTGAGNQLHVADVNGDGSADVSDVFPGGSSQNGVASERGPGRVPLWQGVGGEQTSTLADLVRLCVCDVDSPDFNSFLAPVTEPQSVQSFLDTIFAEGAASATSEVPYLRRGPGDTSLGFDPATGDILPSDDFDLGSTFGSSGLRVAQISDSVWIASRPGLVTFFSWDRVPGSAVVPVRTILGPGNFGDRFGLFQLNDPRLGRGSLVPAIEPGLCTTICLWVTAPADAPGEDSSVFILDLQAMPAGDVFDADPAQDWVHEIRGIPNGHMRLDVDMADLNGDGLADILIGVPGGHPGDLSGDPAASDARGVVYALLGPLSADDLAERVIQVFAGEEPDQRFGGDVDIADLQLDRIPDVAITSRFVTGDDGIRRGAVSLFIGEAPLIDSVSVSDGQTTITGTNLAPIVLIDRVAVTVLEASSTRLVVEGAGDIVLVAGLFGFDAFFLNPPLLPAAARVVDLGFGFNLVGWTGATPIEEALASVEGSFTGVFTWEPESQSFRSFNPNVPAIINDLEELGLGDGLWINIDDPDGATWTQPAFADARSVDLVPGLQLAIWTGPDDTPINEAIAGIAEAVAQMLTWDVAAQRFRTFNPQLPAGLNTLTMLNHGDAFWIEVREAITWDQPPP